MPPLCTKIGASISNDETVTAHMLTYRFYVKVSDIKHGDGGGGCNRVGGGKSRGSGGHSIRRDMFHHYKNICVLWSSRLNYWLRCLPRISVSYVSISIMSAHSAVTASKKLQFK